MAVISFSKKPEEIWHVAGWAFRQVLDDVVSQFPEDKEMANKFEEAKTCYSGLLVEMLEHDFAARVVGALRQVLTRILSGAIRSGIHDHPYGDGKTVEQYHQAL